MAKKQIPRERVIKETSLIISKQIDVNFRNYALYVLEHRGIPDFYDALTNVQRIALMNAPKAFSKTISLVGACISGGYHHGDCLREDTVIHLADGSKISIGDWYKKYPESKFILRSFDTETDTIISAIGHSPRIGQETVETIEIELEDGSIEECSLTHPWYTKRGWILAKDLTEEDEIIDHDMIYNKNIGYDHGTKNL